MPKVCPTCNEKREQDAKKAESDAKTAAITEAWQKICPPLYDDTDPSRISRKLVDAVNGWQPGNKALGFTGEAGCGKTRSMFLLLKRLHFSGTRVQAISAVRLAKMSAEQFSDQKKRKDEALNFLEAALNVPVLFIDDFGKQKFTERAELEIFDILEHRTSNLLPTHWTANASGGDLAAMLSKDRGDPILRRLEEFSEIISN